MMPFSPPPAPPPDAVEATKYKIEDQVYFYKNSKIHLTIRCQFAKVEFIAGKWRKGEVKDHGGSSDDAPRYLVRTYELSRAAGFH